MYIFLTNISLEKIGICRWSLKAIVKPKQNKGNLISLPRSNGQNFLSRKWG